jgi:DNA-binding transcriptional MocR family regulator
MAPTPLTRQIAARIVDYIREEQAAQGTRLVERTLADHLRVSRSPVRSALRLPEDDGIVAAAERGGYTVLRTADQLEDIPAAEDADGDGDEPVHLRIAADRLDGELPDRVTENALARRYDRAVRLARSITSGAVFVAPRRPLDHRTVDGCVRNVRIRRRIGDHRTRRRI